MRRASRGQTLVLAVVTLLVMAATMLASFNLAHTVHERIRLQVAADTHAYSAAVLQARALNTSAYLNRTIAALLVAELALHEWMALASHDVAMLDAAWRMFARVTAMEAALCRPRRPEHCRDARDAFQIMQQYRQLHSQYEAELQAKSTAFDAAVAALSQAIRNTKVEEDQYVRSIADELGGRGVLQTVVSQTAPRATMFPNVHPLNRKNLACALEDSPLDSECSQATNSLVTGRPIADASVRSTVIQNAANAARVPFEYDGDRNVALTHADFRGRAKNQVRNPSLMMRTQREGSFQVNYSGAAFQSRVGQDLARSSNPGHLAHDIGSASGSGWGQVRWRHGFAFRGVNASTFSDQSGGQQNPGGMPHSSFTGMCRDAASCFIHFRSDPTPDTDWGQPNAYGAVSQDLRALQKGGRGAYEVNEQGTITMKAGGKAYRVTLVPRNTGVAVAKAKAYYHQLGASWALQPNAFDPFWRAKLHFLKREQALILFTILGDRNSVEALNGGAPVEGDL